MNPERPGSALPQEPHEPTNKRTEGRYFMKPLPEAELGTFSAAEYETLRRGAAMTFLERLEWIEQVTTLFTGEVKEGGEERRDDGDDSHPRSS